MNFGRIIHLLDDENANARGSNLWQLNLYLFVASTKPRNNGAQRRLSTVRTEFRFVFPMSMLGFARKMVISAPDIVDELLLTVRELVETAKRARERRSVLTEYMVAVG